MRTSDSVRLVFFLLVLGGILLWPVERIFRYERPSVPPKMFRFRAEGFDPGDLLRGHDLELSPQPTKVYLPDRQTDITGREGVSGRRSRCYAVLEPGADGFAEVADLLPEPPADGRFCVPVVYYGCSSDWRNNQRTKEKYHYFRLPFTRYYIDSRLAAEARNVPAESRQRRNVCSISVLVYPDGAYEMKEITVNGISLPEYLRKK